MIRLLKACWGDAATAENDFCFDYLPRMTGDHGTYQTVMDMAGREGVRLFSAGRESRRRVGARPPAAAGHGQPGLAGGPRHDHDRKSPPSGRTAPEIETGEIVTEDIAHRGFLLARCLARGEGGDLHQYPTAAAMAGPGGGAARGCQQSELWFFYHLGRRLKEKLAGSADERDRPLLDLAWDYATEGDEPSGADVLRHVSGIDLRTGRAVDGYPDLRADGSTSCGCWIYSGVYADEVNQARRRKSWRSRDRTAGVGLDLAAESAGAVQPRLGRPTGPPLERAQGPHLVGRRARRVDRPRRPGLREDQAAGLPAARGCRRAAGTAWRRPVHHDVRREGVAVRARGPRGRPTAHALRAARVARAQPAVRPAGQPGAQGLRPPGQPLEPGAARAA